MTTTIDKTRANQTCSALGGVSIRRLAQQSDRRGWLIELFRSDELPEGIRPAMAYASETQPGVVRGPHEHVEQADLFAFFGPGDFELHLWDRREASPTAGQHEMIRAGESNPLAVIVPPGVVHAYKNVSERPGWVFNAPNRLYGGQCRAGPVDEIRWEESGDNPYSID